MQRYAYEIALFQALIATIGSLFFSEVLQYPPCTLCWYQRIFMYPIAIILAVAVYREEHKKAVPYVLSLSIPGLVVAIYHNLLYYNIIPESIAPCQNGISCTTQYIEWFGFVTIPLLSLIAFIVVTSLMLISRRQKDAVRESSNS